MANTLKKTKSIKTNLIPAILLVTSLIFLGIGLMIQNSYNDFASYRNDETIGRYNSFDIICEQNAEEVFDVQHYMLCRQSAQMTQITTSYINFWTKSIIFLMSFALFILAIAYKIHASIQSDK